MKITLKDNVVAEVNKGTTVLTVVSGISESLAKSAICGKINGVLVDLSEEIGKNCKLEIITMRDKDAITVLWHSTAHILAQAVKSVYPNAKLASGNSNENGFYYDFDFKTPITEVDLIKIEEEMQKIIDADFPVVRANITKEQAFLLAEENEEPYKLEIINKIPNSEQVVLFNQGDFSDFCLGPHIKSTGLVKAFKLTNIEKTYFEDNPENKQLTRINGVSFFFKKDLEQFLKNQDLIKKRSHLKIGEELNLFARDSMTDKIVFLRDGQRVLNSINSYMGCLAEEYGFDEISVVAPDNKQLGFVEATAYRVSNKDNISFPVKYYIKEMVEPKVINPSGGLFNNSLNTRDKLVVFSRAETIDIEFKQVFELTKQFYSAFGLNVGIKFHVGDNVIPGDYSKVKSVLKRTIDKQFGATDKIQTGYHKIDVLKVEYVINDSVGREWSLGSLHVDFSYAQKNGIAMNSNGKLEFPITIVSNTCRSFEKLIAIILEHTAGVLPFWLSPTQIKIVATDQRAVLKAKKLNQCLIRYKVYSDIYLAHRGKIKPDNMIPLTVVIGENELKDGSVKLIYKNGSEVKLTTRKFIQEIIKSYSQRDLIFPNL